MGISRRYYKNNPRSKTTDDTPFFSGIVEASCFRNPLYDILLGNIDGVRGPGDPDPNWSKTTDGKSREKVGAVQTRAQKAAIGKPLPKLNVPKALPKVKTGDFKKAQMGDVTLSKCRRLADSHEEAPLNRFLYRNFKVISGEVEDTTLQLVVPKAYRHFVMKMAHESILGGHQGARKTKHKILSDFYWPGCQADITRFCRSCDVCQRTVPKGRVGKLPLGTMPLIETPFQRVAIDIVGPIQPKTDRNNRYILTIVDYATRYPEAVALPSIETTRVAEALITVFSRVGVPREVLTDQGTQFTSDLMREVGRLLSVRQLTTTPYHPACNGLVERFNGTLKLMLRRMCTERPRDWDRYIDPSYSHIEKPLKKVRALPHSNYCTVVKFGDQ
ncbi:hypothetical protein BSL78_04144 [Apostichopus japonicus]|uniref:Integrase catalytic domain-containing protein n=1 Tax=Stichopus japonicus TaxID=307972 RepID=A0A2G8LFB8_STIJA|nr:hypothetical protein BSL78_04144 [Apostichopus japonicus]